MLNLPKPSRLSFHIGTFQGKLLFSYMGISKTPDNLSIICDTSSPRRMARVDTQPIQFFDLAPRYDALSHNGDPL